MTVPSTLATEDLGEHLTEVRALLDRAFEGEFSDEDWDHTLGGLHVLVLDHGRVLSHAAVVERTLRVGAKPYRVGYVEGVATDPSHQGRGIGSEVMAHLGQEVRARFALGALSTDRHRFYERLGWLRWHGPTFVLRGRSRVRTPDEDGGIMVLPGPGLGDLDRTAPITCEERAGDDW